MEKIEDLSTEKLIRRRKLFMYITRLYLGAAVAVFGVLLLELVKGEELTRELLYGGAAILASFWIPYIVIRKIREELTRRAQKE